MKSLALPLDCIALENYGQKNREARSIQAEMPSCESLRAGPVTIRHEFNPNRCRGGIS